MNTIIWIVVAWAALSFLFTCGWVLARIVSNALRGDRDRRIVYLNGMRMIPGEHYTWSAGGHPFFKLSIDVDQSFVEVVEENGDRRFISDKTTLRAMTDKPVEGDKVRAMRRAAAQEQAKKTGQNPLQAVADALGGKLQVIDSTKAKGDETGAQEAEEPPEAEAEDKAVP